MTAKHIAVGLVLVIALAACSKDGSVSDSPSPSESEMSDSPSPSQSEISDVPDYLLNPNVNQSNIKTTICKPGYTDTIRPSSSYTNSLKAKQLAGMNVQDKNPADYEEDHWIPLEIGGNPTNEKNLWPEPRPDARKKDAQENALHRSICSGGISLREAQMKMYRWRR